MVPPFNFVADEHGYLTGKDERSREALEKFLGDKPHVRDLTPGMLMKMLMES